MEKALRVIIPQRFKEKLEERFNPEVAKYELSLKAYFIRVDCALCRYYKASEGACTDCPLAKFSVRNFFRGCFVWMRKVAGHPPANMRFFIDCICWEETINEKAKAWLNKLRQKAALLISWKGR
jgi:hypothetical protein